MFLRFIAKIFHHSDFKICYAIYKTSNIDHNPYMTACVVNIKHVKGIRCVVLIMLLNCLFLDQNHGGGNYLSDKDDFLDP